MASNRPNAFGIVCLVALALWTLFCGAGFLEVTMEVAREQEGLGSGETAATASGVFWVPLWAFGSLVIAVLYRVAGVERGE